MLCNMYQIHAVIIMLIPVTLIITSKTSIIVIFKSYYAIQSYTNTIQDHITLTLPCHNHSVLFYYQTHCPLIIIVMAVTEYTSSLPRGNTVNNIARQPNSLRL